ncbi:MAG: tetratricopeptide repeat protein [Planctomycetes bacterium]|nr:tetratricopeptide repeat protein [Planctomycetota bacterium]
MKNAFKKGLIYCDKFIIGLLLATVVIVPLFFDIRLYSVFDLSKVMALYLLTIAILVVWAIALVFKHGFEFSHTAIDIPILAYIFIFIISSVISINPIMSLFGTYKRFEGLTATLCYILIFCATVNFVTTRRRLYLLVFAIVAGAIISSIYGIAQHVGFDMFKWSSFEARRVFSTFGNPVFFSAYLVMTLPLAVVLFFSNSSQQKEISSLKNSYITWIFFVLSAIIYTTFWLTNTRACFVALLGGLFPLLIVISNKQTAERYKFAVLVISFVLIGIFFNVRHDTSVIKHFVSDVKPTDNHSDSSFNKKEIESVPISIKQQTHTRPWIANKVSFGSSTFSRIFQYLAATRIIKDYSVLGIGPDTIGIVYQKNLAKVFSLLEGDKAFPFPRQDRIHNDVLETEGSLSTEESGPKIKECCEDRKLSGWEGRKAVSAQLPSFPPSRIPVFCKWIGCGIVLTALGFVSIFVVRFYRADAYFEYGRRILDYEKENLPAITEKGLFFMKHAIRLNPYETFYRDELCRTYIQNALKTKDEAWIQKAYVEANNSLKLIPHHYMGFFHLGMIQQFLAEHFNRDTADSAINYYKKAIDSDPFQAPFHSNLASLYINRGNLDQAIEELSQAYLIRPDEVNHADRLANAYLQKGDLDKALFFSRKTVELNPSESGYYNNLGAILSKKGMYEEAVNAFKKAIEINPKEPIYLDNLLKLYLSLEKYDELIPYYKKLIALDPSVADYHNNLGAIYKRKKQPKDAIESFQKAVTLKPDNPIYTHNLASGYVDLGKYAEAKDILQTFNKTYPNNNYINIHLLLADLYLKDTDWEKVISECEQAIKLDEKSIAAYKMLGMAYYNMHKYEFAEKMLNKTLILDPNDQGAKDLLAKISNKVKKDL